MYPMQKRALIFSTTYFPLVGGAEVAMKEVTDRLPEWRFDLFCAKIQPGLLRKEKIGNITVHRCGVGYPIDKYLLPVLGVWQALCVGGIRYRGIVWSLMASYGGFATLVYTWIKPSAQMLLTLQEGDPLEHYAKRTGVFTWLHRSIFVRANAVQAISTFLAAWAIKMGHKRTPVVVPNGVDVERFSTRISLDKRLALRKEYGFLKTDTVIVTASRLALKNGVDDIVRALNFLPISYKALIVGEGEDRDKLTALVASKGLEDRVVFLGGRGHQELPGILQSADIFCRPSLSEGLGNAFLEAMACGLPIIGTPVGGIPDFLIDGETGVFCEPRDPESIAKAVLHIQTETGLREKLISRGALLVREGYGWDGIATRIGVMLEGLSPHV